MPHGVNQTPRDNLVINAQHDTLNLECLGQKMKEEKNPRKKNAVIS